MIRPGASLWRADPREAAVLGIPLGSALGDAARRWPGRDAVVFACQPDVGELRWSYAELDATSTHLARALLARGYRPGERVAVWGPNHPHWILLEYALAKAGLVIVALNPTYRDAELAFALRDSGCVAVFHADEVSGTRLAEVVDRAAEPAVRERFSFSSGIAALLAGDVPAIMLPEVDASTTLMIQYTSGTTGTPKAACISHAAVVTSARNAYRLWSFGDGDRVCHGFPLFHVGGSGNSTPGAMMSGATTLPLYVFRAREALDILESERCTGFIGVPTMLVRMLEEPDFGRRDLGALRMIVIGGAPVPMKLLRECERAFGAEILNGYGQTETCGFTCSTVPGDSAERKTLGNGRPAPGVSVKIVDAEGGILPCDTQGELCCTGPGLMLGYAGAGSGLGFDAEGWLRSGDLGVMDAEGYVRVTGRLKELIIRGGENLSPLEIENLLLGHPDVAEAAVIGLPDPRYGEEVCAVLRPRTQVHADPEEVRAWCRERISRWKVPRYVAFVDAMPVTPSGKVKKFALRADMCARFDLEDPAEERSLR
jgi:fatty-acyl-CoA synthase